MSSKKPKKSRSLKVQVSFEVSRVSDECLASAYEQVIPEQRLPTQKHTKRSIEALEITREMPEESNYFDSLDFGRG
jgi:hypothetical protein